MPGIDRERVSEPCGEAGVTQTVDAPRDAVGRALSKHSPLEQLWPKHLVRSVGFRAAPQPLEVLDGSEP